MANLLNYMGYDVRAAGACFQRAPKSHVLAAIETDINKKVINRLEKNQFCSFLN
jgi:hypothetical protein